MIVFALALAAFSIAIVYCWPFIAATLLEHVLTISGCNQAEDAAQNCSDYLTQLGALGNAFAPLSSLFAGLALAGVAWTLSIEARARKESRKPLVVCEIGDNTGISFDEPQFEAPCSLRLSLELSVLAMNDVAMNVQVTPLIKNNQWSKELKTFNVPTPMELSKGAERNEFRVRLTEDDLEKILQPGDIALVINAKFSSIEGVDWQTTVKYKILFSDVDRQKLRAVRTEQTDDRALWDNGAAATAEAELIPGSWKHSK